jgi:uncharacterized membrane protein
MPTDIRTQARQEMGVDVPPLNSLTTNDLRAALAAGWADFRAAPIFGLFFASVYALGGIALWWGLWRSGQPVWFVAAAAGFPLFAPFAAVGLYEVSRRRQGGLPLDWPSILGAVRGKGDGQLPVMAVIVLLVFGFWVILARGIFAVFFYDSGVGMYSVVHLATLPGVAMMVVGTVAGGLLALALFAVTAFSLPMLLDRPVDFVTAIVTSVAAVRANFAVLLRWAAVIVALLVVGMVPAFLGLLIVLPVLGHATWHLYDRAIGR